jgi:hypothetical protein
MTRSVHRLIRTRSPTVMIAAALPVLWISGVLDGKPAARDSSLRIVSSSGITDSNDSSGIRTATAPLISSRQNYGRPANGLGQGIRRAKGDPHLGSDAGVDLRGLRDTGKRVKLIAVRNPFEFSLGDTPSRPKPSRTERVTLREHTAQGTPPILLSLIGVAASHVDGRVDRTALITGPGDALIYAREGDTVMGRYRADAVQPDSILLVDLTTGSPLRLTLR